MTPWSRLLLTSLTLATLSGCAAITLTSGGGTSRHAFVGIWASTYGELTIEAEGDRLSGTYDDGELKGTLEPDGRTLVGTWSEAPSGEPEQDAGHFTFTLTPEGNRFEGTWGYGEGPDAGSWEGEKTEGPVVAGGPDGKRFFQLRVEY